MNELVLAGLLGGVGGLTRGVVGLLKALALKCRKSQILQQILTIFEHAQKPQQFIINLGGF